MIRIKRNPTDQTTIDKLSIVKHKNESGDIEYLAYIKDKLIGGLGFNIYKGYVIWIQIDNKYRRKGIASFMYKYVENDLNIKIDQPSPYLLNDGKKFWQSRSKRNNPTDLTFLSKIKIEKVKIKYYIRYNALLNNSVIATADFFPQDNSVSSVYVTSAYRRKGLASFMYNHIEKDQKVSLIPSQDLLPDGRRFWENRLKNKPKKLGLLYR